MKEHLPSPLLQLCETLQGVNQNLYEQCQQPSFPWIALGGTLVLLVLIGIGFQKSPQFTGIVVLVGSWALAVFCLAMMFAIDVTAIEPLPTDVKAHIRPDNPILGNHYSGYVGGLFIGIGTALLGYKWAFGYDPVKKTSGRYPSKEE